MPQAVDATKSAGPNPKPAFSSLLLIYLFMPLAICVSATEITEML